MTHVLITHAESCDAAPGLVNITVTISNAEFGPTLPVQSIDLYGSLLANQPPLSAAGAWPKVLHATVPPGTYTAGAQFHFTDAPTRATEITIVVPEDMCAPATTIAPPRSTTTTVLEVGTPVTIAPTTTTTAPPAVSVESEPKVEPAPPPSVAGSTTTAAPVVTGHVLAATTELPRTGSNYVTPTAELGLLVALVGAGLLRLGRRDRRAAR